MMKPYIWPVLLVVGLFFARNSASATEPPCSLYPCSCWCWWPEIFHGDFYIALKHPYQQDANYMIVWYPYRLCPQQYGYWFDAYVYRFEPQGFQGWAPVRIVGLARRDAQGRPMAALAAEGVQEEDFGSRTTQTTEKSTARFVVNVPAEARVFVDGEITKQSGPLRTFRSPVLEQGVTYAYKVKIEFDRHGEVVTDEQVVNFQAGDVFKLTLPQTHAEVVAKKP